MTDATKCPKTVTCKNCGSKNVVAIDENNTFVGRDWISYECDNCGECFTKLKVTNEQD